MKTNADTLLRGYNGKPLTQVTENEYTCISCGYHHEGKVDDLALKDVCVNALLATLPEERKQSLSGKQKLQFDALARRLYAGGTVELDAKEVALIEDRLEKLYGVIIYAQAHRMLENEDSLVDAVMGKEPTDGNEGREG